jgi:hypothetical protein
MNLRIFRSTLPLLALMPLGCDGELDPSTTSEALGVLELALSAEEAMGGQWRLEGAEFTITDTTLDLEVMTLTDTGASPIARAKLPPGEYEVAIGGA